MQKGSIKLIDFIVIGGGYTGLSVSTELIDHGYKIQLFEKSNSLGGLGNTISLSNGFKCESYYHHFFTQDLELIKYCERFLDNYPNFHETKMSIFFKKCFYSWNGIIDLMSYPYINMLGKFRFIFVTFLLSKGLLNSEFLDINPLSDGLKILYGEMAYESVWGPMLRGKFGDKTNIIPLRWMKGRLKQRIESRKKGREKLGFLKGSLNILTEKIKNFILKNNSIISCQSEIMDIKFLSKEKSYLIKYFDNKSETIKETITKNIVLTIPNAEANSLIKNFQIDKKWSSHKYFTAYCVLVEMNQSLSNYYWTNIADEDIFFCGYIEQTNLTGKNEYGGIHLAYLTKYVYLENKTNCFSKEVLKKKAIFALKKLFPKKEIDKIVINLHVSIAPNAQVITDFNFKKSDMKLLSTRNIYLANMSNVYPDERSINNAIKVGKELFNNINFER